MIVCADAWHDDFPAIIRRAQDVMRRRPIGIYAPNIDWTSWAFDRRRLPPIEPDLYHVPQTDGIVVFVRREVFCALPPLDPSVNKIGWGIDACLIALAQQKNLWVCRDYRFTVNHPHGHGYQITDANQQMVAWIQSLSPQLRADTTRVINDAVARKVRQ